LFYFVVTVTTTLAYIWNGDLQLQQWQMT